DATLAGGLDLRGPAPVTMDGKQIRQMLTMATRGREKEELIKLVDKFGNVQVDRISFAHASDPKEMKKDKIWIRVTGRADRKRIVEFIKANVTGSIIAEEKGPKEEPISIVHAKDQPPAFALVGDHDIIIGGYEGNQGDHLPVVRDALEVLAGRKPA